MNGKDLAGMGGIGNTEQNSRTSLVSTNSVTLISVTTTRIDQRSKTSVENGTATWRKQQSLSLSWNGYESPQCCLLWRNR